MAERAMCMVTVLLMWLLLFEGFDISHRLLFVAPCSRCVRGAVHVLAEFLCGFFQFPQQAEHFAKVVMRVVVVWIQPHRFTQCLRSLVVLFEIGKGSRRVEMAKRGIGPDTDNFLEFRQSFGNLSLARKRNAEIVVGIDVIGINAQSFTEFAYGARRVLLSPVDQSEIRMTYSVFRVKTDRFLEFRSGLRNIALFHQGVAEFV